MEVVRESCRKLEQVLGGIEKNCHEIVACVDEFDRYVGHCALDRLSRKLVILAGWVVARTQCLYKEHQGQGYVSVFVNEREGVNVLWVKDEEIVADKEYYKGHGSTVLSVGEANYLLFNLNRELASGNWAKVVDWIKRYGRSPGLDFGELM